MNLLFIGDVMGPPGLRVLKACLRDLREQLGLDLVIANGENVADGNGVTREHALEMFGAGVDVISNGNHAWDKREALEYIAAEPRLLRPYNYPPGTPGRGWCVANVSGERIAVINVLGTVHMNPVLDCAFKSVDRALAEIPDGVRMILVDLHGTCTTEKMTMSWYLDGRVSALIGTHTHVPTADERVLPRGTAYITDVGMTGCYDSVVGLGIPNALARLKDKLPAPYDLAEGRARLCGVVVDVDESTGKSRSIRRVAVEEPSLIVSTVLVSV